MLAVWPGGQAWAGSARPRVTRERDRLVVRERAGLSDAALARVLRRVGAVRVRRLERLNASLLHVAPESLRSIERTLRRSRLFKTVEQDGIARVAETVNDPSFASQWALSRIAAPVAWQISSGAPHVPVAVLDTGVDFSHPDLAGRVLAGYDFINRDGDPADDHGHGTRMTGVVAALRNNGLGIVGVAPEAAILPVKVLNASGSGGYSAIAEGITYAVDQGARILSLSLAGSVSSDLLQSAVDYASARGAIVVAAAGNAGTSTLSYPAACRGALGVGATGTDDRRAGFSNFGSHLALAAPGVNILTTFPGGSYGYSSGTSPATAFGAAVFALLLAADPALSREEAIARVEAGAADLGPTGWDPEYGAGRLDAYAALAPGQVGSPPFDAKAPTVSILSPSPNALVSGMVPVDVLAADDSAIDRVTLTIDGQAVATETVPPYSFVIEAAAFPSGTRQLVAHAYDSSGNSTRAALKVMFTPGTGLLVGRAKVKADRVQLKANFVLPGGAAMDPGRDGIEIALTGADGRVFHVSIPPGTLAVSSRGKMTGTFTPALPGAGTVRVAITPPGRKPYHILVVNGLKLVGLREADLLMDVSVQIGDAVLSQGIGFRSRRTQLVYP